jgi:hypothetical protein
VAAIIAVTDLPAKLQTVEMVADMVAGANAKALRVAPCLGWDGSVTDQPAPSADQIAEARLILLGAVKRWAEAGSGALQAQQAGPFGVTVDTRQRTGFNLWPSEITGLQDICKTADEGRREAFSIDTAPAVSVHLPWCDLMFGGTTCSCGASLTNYEYPIYELD